MDAGGVESGAQGPLGLLGQRAQGLEDEPALLALFREEPRAGEVRLLPHHNQERGRLSGLTAGKDARVDLLRPRGSRPGEPETHADPENGICQF